MKKILLLLLLTVSILFGGAKFNDLRLLHYPQARPWLEDADTNGASANNIGILYYKTIKDNKKAIEWLKKAYKLSSGEGAGQTANSLGYIYNDLKKYNKAEKWYKIAIKKNNKDAALNLGLLYKKLHRYNDAIFYYKKAYKMGNIGAATSLGYLYRNYLDNIKIAIKWYKTGAKEGDKDAINNLGGLYHDLNDDLKASAYILAMVNYGYTKKEVFDFLKNKWKIDNETIKKAYFLQKTLDIPKHYYDAEFEGKPQTKRRGRR